MSKIKLAITLFGVAFGVNILAFVLFKSNWLIEENKMVWLYELPRSASPLDSGVATDFGPSQGIQGVLIRPGNEQVIENELAESWVWNDHTRTLTFKLNPLLKYQNGEVIEASHFVEAASWVKQNLEPHRKILSQEWQFWLDTQYVALSSSTLEIKFNKNLSLAVSPENLLNHVFSQALTGVIHPLNLAALKKGEVITKEWISSGPYRVRKWNPKEIFIVSRSDFPLGMKEGFFRVLKYQSAPVKNPAAAFMQATAEQPIISDDHHKELKNEQLFVFWICRSWQEKGSVCADADARAAITEALDVSVLHPTHQLSGKTVRYRIPFGSELFREKVRDQIRDRLNAAGAVAQEVSFFFKNSKDTDLELQFVSVLKGENGLAVALSLLSSRMNAVHKIKSEHFIGEITHFDQALQWKGDRVKGVYETFKKVFLEPDMSDKRMPL